MNFCESMCSGLLLIKLEMSTKLTLMLLPHKEMQH